MLALMPSCLIIMCHSLLNILIKQLLISRSEERFSRNAETEIYTLSLHDALPIFTWEKLRTVNVGLDAQLFNNHVSFTAEYFNKTTFDIKIGRAVQQECRDRDLHSFPTRRSSDLYMGKAKNSKCWP